MAPSKLSDADKQDIIALYKNPGETTSTLAERYGVSNSTISRLLKSSLPEAEYSVLIQQKRSASDAASAAAPSSPPPNPHQTKITAAATTPEPAVTESENPGPKSHRRTRSRKTTTSKKVVPAATPAATTQATAANVDNNLESSGSDPKAEIAPAKAAPTPRRRSRQRSSATAAGPSDQLNLLDSPESTEAITETIQESKRPRLKLRNRDQSEVETSLEEIDVLDDEDTVLPTQDDDYGDEDDWDDEDEDEDGEGDEGVDAAQFPSEAIIQIIPLTQDVLPKPCYLVVDRMAELVTQPLKSFGDLGPLPEAETTAKTLPVFDNHRVARRFTQRNQRVVKVPDGGMLHKTSTYLQAKGITHLLIDGQVYSLTP